ncbi:MAG: ComF family protein [Dethiobacteria bacterium]|jgi:competence protein ComFC
MSILQFFLDLFYPPRCYFCGSLLDLYPKKGRHDFSEGNLQEFETILCRNCLLSLPWLQNCCSHCALPNPQNLGVCPFCSEIDFAFNGCCAVVRYKGDMREVLYRFKYRGQKILADPLGKLMAVKIKNMPWHDSLDLVTPVPLAPEKLLQRGYNQSALLAQVVSRELRLPMQELLIRNKNTKSQTGLNRQQRWVNVQGSFASNNILQKGTVLLIDDVLTSGSTAHEASLVLKKAGCRQVYVAVLAR